MKLFKGLLVPISLVLISTASPQKINAQGTAFTYQGRLNSAGNAASGTYDFAFALYNDPSAGTQQGPALTNSAVVVSNGLFTTAIDFGASPFKEGL